MITIGKFHTNIIFNGLNIFFIDIINQKFKDHFLHVHSPLNTAIHQALLNK